MEVRAFTWGLNYWGGGGGLKIGMLLSLEGGGCYCDVQLILHSVNHARMLVHVPPFPGVHLHVEQISREVGKKVECFCFWGGGGGGDVVCFPQLCARGMLPPKNLDHFWKFILQLLIALYMYCVAFSLHLLRIVLLLVCICYALCCF